MQDELPQKRLAEVLMSILACISGKNYLFLICTTWLRIEGDRRREIEELTIGTA